MTKKIVLFADGTGNAFTEQESNVWRLYQALDAADPDIETHYIPGVGTSKIWLVAMIDAATGFGVPANVRKLYRFLCWNWNAGAEVYLFGFSRGSFTIRTLAAMIASQGLMPSKIGDGAVSHAEMDRNVMGAWRAYRERSAPFEWTKMSPLVWLTRRLRDFLIRASRRLAGAPLHSEVLVERDRAQPERKEISLAFMGLFDTVEAFGVPIEELRRAVDYALWPISFRNHRIACGVRVARHALSLDDERTTFHPLRMDQSPRPKHDPCGQPATDIREVWFSGVHSDVGGGYPDGGASFAPLLWMAGEARDQGLDFRAGPLEEWSQQVSPTAPLHDSRAGLSVYYRYGPRKIGTGVADGGPPVVHHSVVERIVSGCDGYAPLVLPRHIKILLPSRDVVECPVPPKQARAFVAAAAETRDALTDALKLEVPPEKFMSRVRDLIWRRRVVYFLLVFATLWFVALPALNFDVSDGGSSPSAGGMLQSLDGSFAAMARSTFGAVAPIMPAAVKPWFDFLAQHPFSGAISLGVILSFYLRSCALRDRIRDYAHDAWFSTRKAVPESEFAGGETWTRRFRKSRIVNRLANFATQRVFFALGVFAIYLAAATFISRASVNALNAAGAICRPVSPGPGLALKDGATTIVRGFTPASPCFDTGVEVTSGATYLIKIKQTEPFADQTVYAPPAGFKACGWAFRAGLPFRRWWRADWFAPIAQIGERAAAEFPLTPINGVLPRPSTSARDRIEVEKRLALDEPYTAAPGADRARQELLAMQAGEDTFVARFAAPARGRLYVYVNDVLPAFLGLKFTAFYENNAGRADIAITREPCCGADGGK
ncbi:DUF2235 domain-containing protein [Rhodoblastus sp.]|uniref:DUF2235 domain-containing protein n=1 Tax=Rhodoblastus sp. TaxID=1962975 RepID=UPI00261815D2|nr:DUF2235 domain-containing protein [Rhodoblastus sp.]